MDVDQTVTRIEQLLAEMKSAPAEEVVRLLMQLYGAALERIIQQSLNAEQLAEDKLVGSLLLLHDLHPLDPEARLRRMLARLERSFDSHFHLEGIDENIARIRVERNGTALPPGIGEMVERAAFDAAPDLAGVTIVGLPIDLVQIR